VFFVVGISVFGSTWNLQSKMSQAVFPPLILRIVTDYTEEIEGFAKASLFT
jgi:hypothetical protein